LRLLLGALARALHLLMDHRVIPATPHRLATAAACA
jgi:hypothetical protein